MAKFKKGDKVVVTENSAYFKVGDMLIVDQDDNTCPYVIPIKSEGTERKCISQCRIELYEEPTKRIPKVGDRIRVLKTNTRNGSRRRWGDIFTIGDIKRFDSKLYFDDGTDDGKWVDAEYSETREFYDGPIPERFQEGNIPTTTSNCESGEIISVDNVSEILQAARDLMSRKDPWLAEKQFLLDRAFYGTSHMPRQCTGDMTSYGAAGIPEPPPLSTIKKIMGKLEQFRTKLYFTDKKMEKIGELADKLEGYQNDIDDLVNNLRLISSRLESYIEDIETAVDEDDRIAAELIIDEATEYISKVSTLDSLASMLSNAKALDKFTDKD